MPETQAAEDVAAQQRVQRPVLHLPQAQHARLPVALRHLPGKDHVAGVDYGAREELSFP